MYHFSVIPLFFHHKPVAVSFTTCQKALTLQLKPSYTFFGAFLHFKLFFLNMCKFNAIFEFLYFLMETEGSSLSHFDLTEASKFFWLKVFK